MPKIITAGFHDEAIDTDDRTGSIAICSRSGRFQDLLRNERFANLVGTDDRIHQGFWDAAIIRLKFFRVLGQAIPAISKGGIIVMPANPRIKADAIDDGFCIHALYTGIGIKFIEIGHTQGKVGIGKKFDRFRL